MCKVCKRQMATEEKETHHRPRPKTENDGKGHPCEMVKCGLCRLPFLRGLAKEHRQARRPTARAEVMDDAQSWREVQGAGRSAPQNGGVERNHPGVRMRTHSHVGGWIQVCGGKQETAAEPLAGGVAADARSVGAGSCRHPPPPDEGTTAAPKEFHPTRTCTVCTSAHSLPLPRAKVSTSTAVCFLHHLSTVSE